MRLRPVSTRAFTLIDLCALLFLIAVLGFTAVRTSFLANNGNSRTTCASNLRQIGQSIQIYANENKGGFPRTYFKPSANPVPTEYTGVNASDPFADDGPGPNDVSSGLYLLLREGDITSEVFLCPMAQGMLALAPWVPPNGATIKSFSNFSGRINLSYGYTNAYPTDAARKLGFKLNYTLSSDFAIAADMGRGPVAAKTPADAPRQAMIDANSPNHGGDGQNVLYADGHVDWAPTMYAGSPRRIGNSPRDNIYAFGVDADMKSPSVGSHGAPQDQYDSVILPTADLGPQPGPIPPPTAKAPDNSRWLYGSATLATFVAFAVALYLLRKARNRRNVVPPLPPQTA